MSSTAETGTTVFPNRDQIIFGRAINDLRAGDRLYDADLPLAAWSAGYVIGWLAGITEDQALEDVVTDAGRVRWSATYDLKAAAGRWELLGTAKDGDSRIAFFRACGALYGWKRGTAHRDDADECGLCESRILTDSQGVNCYHGWACDEDCRRSICDGACFEPSFDKDVYYANKYGDEY